MNEDKLKGVLSNGSKWFITIDGNRVYHNDKLMVASLREWLIIKLNKNRELNFDGEPPYSFSTVCQEFKNIVPLFNLSGSDELEQKVDHLSKVIEGQRKTIDNLKEELSTVEPDMDSDSIVSYFSQNKQELKRTIELLYYSPLKDYMIEQLRKVER